MMRYFLVAAAVALLLDLTAANLCIVKPRPHAPGEASSVLALDVCSKGAPAVAHGAEYTFVDSASLLPAPAESGGVEPSAPAFASSVLAEPTENPPNS